MIEKHWAEIGSVSERTLHPLDVFDNIFYWIKSNPDRIEYWEANQVSDGLNLLFSLWLNGNLDDLFSFRLIDESNTEIAYLLNEELFTFMQEYCPPYVYFGSHIGDGADIGFWPDIEGLQEDQTYGELDSSYSVEVNDHGNVSFFIKGNLAWDCV